jgi:hypothetical protein
MNSKDFENKLKELERQLEEIRQSASGPQF